jgi:hypothetical protein
MNFDSGSRVVQTVFLTLFSSLALSQGASNGIPAKPAGGAGFKARAEIPQSTFNIGPEYRNPFFPSSAVAVKPAKANKETGPDLAALVLNGITSAPKPTAMVNGKTFETGEEADVRLRDGSKIRIRCLEIKADSAIIEVNGQPHEVRLRFGN